MSVLSACAARCTPLACAASSGAASSGAEPPVVEPSVAEVLLDALFLQSGYNSTVVLLGAVLLGIAGGLVGAFTLLGRQSLVVDAFAHATLAGVAAAFLGHAAIAGADYERSLPVLLFGAAVAGLLAVGAISLLSSRTRLSTDTATAAVSSASFGIGIVLLSIARQRSGADQAGLDHLIFGATASMSRGDAFVMGVLAAVAIVAALLLHRPLIAVLFNRRFARTSGLPIALLDASLAALSASVALAGLQAVGMLLVVAILVIPPTTARLWTRTTSSLLTLSALLGAAAAWVGASLSAALPSAPAGALIVLVAATLFGVSLLVAPRRGILGGALRRAALRQKLRARGSMTTRTEVRHG